MLRSFFLFNFILFIIIILSGCSKNKDNNNLNVNLPSQIVKIKGKFIAIIPQKKLVLKNNVLSNRP